MDVIIKWKGEAIGAVEYVGHYDKMSLYVGHHDKLSLLPVLGISAHSRSCALGFLISPSGMLDLAQPVLFDGDDVRPSLGHFLGDVFQHGVPLGDGYAVRLVQNKHHRQLIALALLLHLGQSQNDEHQNQRTKSNDEQYRVLYFDE